MKMVVFIYVEHTPNKNWWFLLENDQNETWWFLYVNNIDIRTKHPKQMGGLYVENTKNENGWLL